MFGNPETTTGGNALKFYSSVRVDIRRTASIKSGQETIGNRTRARIVKNKIAPPFKDAEFDIIFGEGVSKYGELIDLALANNIINRSGTWFSYEENRMGQGRDNAKMFLKENNDIANEIESKIRSILKLPTHASEPGKEEKKGKSGK